MLLGAGALLLFNEPFFRAFDESAKGLDPRLALIPWALLVVYALLKANYAEIARRDAAILDLKEQIKSMHGGTKA